MIEIKDNESKFCAKHGVIHEDRQDCPQCHSPLNFTESYKLVKKCNSCGEEVKATPSYFVSINNKCPSCEEGKLEKEQNNEDAPHFVFEGKWDGRDRTHVIQEKNRELRKKVAGYSYEQQSIKESVMKQAKEKGIL